MLFLSKLILKCVHNELYITTKLDCHPLKLKVYVYILGRGENYKIKRTLTSSLTLCFKRGLYVIATRDLLLHRFFYIKLLNYSLLSPICHKKFCGKGINFRGVIFFGQKCGSLQPTPKTKPDPLMTETKTIIRIQSKRQDLRRHINLIGGQKGSQNGGQKPCRKEEEVSCRNFFLTPFRKSF